MDLENIEKQVYNLVVQLMEKSGPFSWVKAGGSDNEITGVTSATFTSKAVIECVNDSLQAFSMLGGKG